MIRVPHISLLRCGFAGPHPGQAPSSTRMNPTKNFICDRPRQPGMIVSRNTRSQHHRLIPSLHPRNSRDIHHRKVHRNPPQNRSPATTQHHPPPRPVAGRGKLPPQPIRIPHRQQRHPHRRSGSIGRVIPNRLPRLQLPHRKHTRKPRHRRLQPGSHLSLGRALDRQRIPIKRKPRTHHRTRPHRPRKLHQPARRRRRIVDRRAVPRMHPRRSQPRPAHLLDRTGRSAPPASA